MSRLNEGETDSSARQVKYNFETDLSKQDQIGFWPLEIYAS
jgi:hypothetical protein